MNGNHHFLVGLACGIGASILLSADPTETTLLISTSLIGSVFPDIDNETSHFGQLTKPVSTIVNAFGNKGGNHRGVLHALGVYVAGLILSYIYFKPLLGFFIGGLSHLLLDSMTPAGIPILPLFSTMRLHMGKIRGDSPFCGFISGFIAILIISGSLFFKLYY